MNSLLQNAFQGSEYFYYKKFKSLKVKQNQKLDESNSIQCAYVKAIGDLYFKLKKLLCAYVTYNLALYIFIFSSKIT